MTEVERLNEALDRKTLKLSDAYKKIARLSIGEEVPRKLRDILSSATFHLGIAMRQYKAMLADPALAERERKLLQGQSNDCADLLGLFEFIRVPEDKR